MIAVWIKPLLNSGDRVNLLIRQAVSTNPLKIELIYGDSSSVNVKASVNGITAESHGIGALQQNQY